MTNEPAADAVSLLYASASEPKTSSPAASGTRLTRSTGGLSGIVGAPAQGFSISARSCGTSIG